jgi:predicted Zn-dependent protease
LNLQNQVRRVIEKNPSIARAAPHGFYPSARRLIHDAEFTHHIIVFLKLMWHNTHTLNGNAWKVKVMKFWTSLITGFLSIELCLGAAFCLELSSPQPQTRGTSYVTQINNARSTADYDNTFGDNWQSVRTFRLLSPLDKPLKVYVERQPKAASLYQPQYRDYVLEGLNQWSSALDNRLRFTLTNKLRDADITVDWVPAFDDRYVAGLTTYSIGHATVEIKTVGVPDKDIKCNIIHELGHALGISGHSGNAGDVMVGMRKWHRDNAPYDPKLSMRDVQAIRRLYSMSWQKGEDLFSANAQRLPVLAAIQPSIPVKTIEQGQQAVKTQAAEMAYLNGHTASAQAINNAPDLQAIRQRRPQYTQIFPKY